jgi:hypothetical protein
MSLIFKCTIVSGQKSVLNDATEKLKSSLNKVLNSCSSFSKIFQFLSSLLFEARSRIYLKTCAISSPYCLSYFDGVKNKAQSSVQFRLCFTVHMWFIIIAQ